MPGQSKGLNVLFVFWVSFNRLHKWMAAGLTPKSSPGFTFISFSIKISS